VDFEGHSIYDIGAFPEPPLSGKITQRVMQPWTLPKDEKEAAAVRKMQDMIEKLKRKREAKS